MDFNFHDKITLPDLGRQAVIDSVRKAEDIMQRKEVAEKNVALDFYYNHNLDTHLAQWFPGNTLSQVPAFPMRIVPRFAKARMMVLKGLQRFINGDFATEYLDHKEYKRRKSKGKDGVVKRMDRNASILANQN